MKPTRRPRRWLRTAGVLGGSVTLAAGALAATGPARAADATPKAVSSPASLVNTIVGTSGAVDTFPGADVPFGMMQWSPDTPSRPAGGGYEYNDSDITGFSLTHISGPGCGAGGDIPILPFVGDVGSNPGSLKTPFSHTGEQAKAGYYQVKTGTGDNAVTTSLTDSLHSGIGKFAFPSSKAANLVVKLNGSATTVDGTSATVVGNKELIGSVKSGHFCGSGQQNDYTLHFDLKFNAPFTASSYGTASGGGPAGEVLTFDTTAKQTVTAKVGISYTSDTNAVANLSSEIPDWNFAKVRSAATASWDQILGKIEIGGGSRTQQSQFYTALYHALLHPNVFSDVNGDYMGFDNKVHQAASGHAQYANYSGWDIYRSQVQLAAMVAPKETSDVVTSMLNEYDEIGQMPKWSQNNGESYVMVGDPADAIIADAYAFGARDFDTSHALSAMVDQATQTSNVRPGQSTRDTYGYLPYDKSYGCCNFYGPVSTQLEYDSADYSIAAFADSLGNNSVYNQFATRAQDWQNTFNPATGYVQAKQADGQWVPGFSPSTGTGMVEGTASQYTPMVPFNIKSLATAKGGNAAYGKFLDSLFTSITEPSGTNADLSNEPSVDIPWQYDYIGQPWRTQQVVRQAQQQLYFDKPVGQFGNDDLGAMSSWYVWSELGLYPSTPGTQTLVIGSPVFPLAQVHQANGKTTTITAANAATNAPYVQGMTINGKANAKPWTTFTKLTKGASLDFDLGTAPNTTWGTAASAAPPSDGTGQTPAFTSVGPSSLIEEPGATQAGNVSVTNVSSRKLTVKWSLTAEKGVTVSPTSGSITVAPGATETAPLKVTADATSEGRYSIGATFKTASGRHLPSSSVSVSVAKSGEVWPYYTNAGVTDDNNTSAASFDSSGFSYSADALSAAGVTPGSTVKSGAISYTWPNVPSGTPNNIEESGQTIPLNVPAGATSIGLLGSATNGDPEAGAGGDVTVHYTDGTSSTFSANFSDWTLNAGGSKPVEGDTTVATLPYRNGAGNQHDNVNTYLFSVSGALTAGKTVASITLPKATGGDAHVFAIGFDGTTSASSQAHAKVPHIPAAPHITAKGQHVQPQEVRRH